MLSLNRRRSNASTERWLYLDACFWREADAAPTAGLLGLAILGGVLPALAATRQPRLSLHGGGEDSGPR
jgi:hypothetical protein